MKNKNLSWGKVILPVFILLFSLNSVDAQVFEGNREHVLQICNGGNWHENPPPPSGGSQCAPETISASPIKINGEVNLQISAYAVSLPLNPLTDAAYFPTDYPKPYLEYEYSPGVFKQTSELVNWEYVTMLKGQDGVLRPLYKSTKYISIIPPVSLECNEDISSIVFPMKLSLKTYDFRTPGWGDYPIDLYGLSDDIFSCQIFNDNLHLCYNVSQIPPITSIYICMECLDRLGDPPIDGRLSNSNSETLKTFPNPFSSSLEYFYQADRDSNILVELLNSNGIVVKRIVHNVIKGENRFFLDALDLAAGIYYLNVTNDKNRNIIKLVHTQQ